MIVDTRVPRITTFDLVHLITCVRVFLTLLTCFVDPRSFFLSLIASTSNDRVTFQYNFDDEEDKSSSHEQVPVKIRVSVLRSASFDVLFPVRCRSYVTETVLYTQIEECTNIFL